MALLGFHMVVRHPRKNYIVAIACAVMLCACTQETPERTLQRAEQYLSRQKNNEALIELRNAVALAPNSARANRLLGTQLLRIRDLSNAESALRRALELGEPADEVLPDLARAMNAQARQEQLLSEFGSRRLKQPEAEASWQSSLGTAWLERGRVDEARLSFDAALAAMPSYVAARLGQARIAASREQFDEASSIVDGVIKDDPGFAEAYAFKAQVLLAQGHRPEAKQVLERSVAIDKDYLAARVALVAMQIEDREYDAARHSLSAAVPSVANDARLVFLRSQLALRTGDLQAAHGEVLKILKERPAFVPALILAGEIELRSNSLAWAESHLKDALHASPNSPPALRLLAATYLRQGRPGVAVDVLQPLLEATMDSDLAALAAECYLASGDPARAAVIFKTMQAAEPSAAFARLRLGQIALARGDFDGGQAELQAASAMDAGHGDADVALVALHLRRREPKKALAAAQQFRNKQPKNPQAHVLVGLAQMAINDAAGARQSFEAALAVKLDHVPAARGLAELDIADGRPEAARQRYEAMLRKRADDYELMLAMAELQDRGGDSRAAVATLRRAVTAHPELPTAQVLLVRLHMRGQDGKAAVAAAQDAVNANPGQPRLLELLGDAQQASGAGAEAARTYWALATLEPLSLRPLLKRAAVLETLRDFRSAAATLRHAQQIAPANDAIARRLVAANLAARAFDEAIEAAVALQARKPGASLGHVLEGNVHASRRNWRDAERAYRKAMALEPGDDEPAIQMVLMLRASGRPKEGAALEAQWLGQHPGDVRMRIVVADALLKAGNYKGATEHYEAILKGSPGNVLALNNLAWTLGRLKDPRAISFGERALAQAPDNADVLDTLGLLHLERGDPGSALDLFERGRYLAPARADFRLHHAQALLQMGRIDEGRAELGDLASLARDDRRKAEIAALLRTAERKTAR